MIAFVILCGVVAVFIIIALRNSRPKPSLPKIELVVNATRIQSWEPGHYIPEWQQHLSDLHTELKQRYYPAITVWKFYRVAGIKHAFARRADAESSVRCLAIANPVRLVRQADNPHDANAIAVIADIEGSATRLGWIPAVDAVELAPRLDSGTPHLCFLAAKLREGNSPGLRLALGFVGQKYWYVSIKPITKTAQERAEARERREAKRVKTSVE